MDITQALKDAENALRDFISASLQKTLGDDWENKCGVSEERLAKWRERKQIEQKRQESGTVEERLIYYADFYDLKTILKKNWPGDFSEVLGDWKTMEVWLEELEKLRDPDAHRRELLPHQKHLALGISGEIRTRLVRFRSKQENAETYFPKIESVRDNLGNIWALAHPSTVVTQMNLRSGDVIEFVVTATDPFNEKLEYAVNVPGTDGGTSWQEENVLSLTIEPKHISRNRMIMICVRSPRKYRGMGNYDDMVIFMYDILPPKTGIP